MNQKPKSPLPPQTITNKQTEERQSTKNRKTVPSQEKGKRRKEKIQERERERERERGKISK